MRDTKITTPIPKQITALIDRFSEQREVYTRASYNETQVRREFIDPLFKALGWDIDNTGGKPEQYKDVIHEDAIKIGGATKAPDYCFRTGGDRKFFVEAKKPSVPLSSHQDSAFQLKRYAWSAGLPVGILTDFEEIAIYDCRIRPGQGDPVTKARLHYFRCDELPDRWQELSGLFSKQAVENGSLDEFTKAKARGSATVDKEFLKEIERWRELLAKNVAVRNRKLTTEQLNTAVQRTIDRLIFFRICEDRGIESYERLRELTKGPGTYKKLTDLFRYADKRYNSGLFHFADERGQATPPDTLSLTLKIDDAPLKDIITHLYYPESPYEFSVLPTEILGHVYEQFLGKVIRLTAGHHAKIEEKPEVRKAGGVYYTPRYIVDYIVQHTVGELVNGKTPAQVAKLKVLDPACGSGSFLLGAYQYLLDWHRDRYVEDEAKAKKPGKHSRGKDPKIYRAAGEEWRLTAPEKRRILLNNIHGVDIDAQAVEVTKLSLLLKVLEDVSGDALQQQFGVLQERALPDLGNNIKCGNSLIGHNYFEGELLPDDEELRRINPFDWEDEFAEIMRGGGFDAVIGNPPYVDSEWMTREYPQEREYMTRSYESASGNWDLFCVFIEKSLLLTKTKGIFGYIVPNKLLSADYANGARKLLASTASIAVRDYSKMRVFPVAVYPIVFIALKEKDSKTNNLYEQVTDWDISEGVLGIDVDGSPWTHADAKLHNLHQRLAKPHSTLEDFAKISGAATVSEAYEIKNLISEGSATTKPSELKVINSGTVDPFLSLWGSKPMQYLGTRYNRPIISTQRVNNLPVARRKQARKPKIIVAGMTRRIEAVLDERGEYLAGKSTTIVIPKKNVSSQSLIAILNSMLATYWLKNQYSGIALAGGYLRLGPPQLKTLPIPVSSSSNAKVIKKLESLSKTISQVIRAGKTNESSRRQVAALRRELDTAVYRLYGLTKTEIEAIEASRTGT
ncbi:MAG: DNA methyltransferase [Patescibacteria group bacterium]